MNKSIGKKGQNEIAQAYLKGSDLAEREKEVLEDAVKRTRFIPNKIIGRSSWWGSKEIGAFHYLGKFESKKAVLKIQGIKPSISEIYMINSFAKLNKSKLVRPPHLYAFLDWDDEKRYEALVLEFIEEARVVNSPTNSNEIKSFFEIYKDYKANCLHRPWVDKPKETIPERITNAFNKWREASFKIYPDHPLRKADDKDLIDEAIAVLKKGYQRIEPEFMHGHLSDGDLYKVDNKIVILSNLYWSWRQPLYDAIFGYHWFTYHLANIDRITPKEIENQRELWLEKIMTLAESKNNRNLLNLALLERATAGLNLDVLSVDLNKPTSKYLVEITRKQIKKLISELT